jgi:hypothetical protein
MDTGSVTQIPPSKPADPAKKSAGSSIKLGDEELEVVLGGSKSGSDVTQSPTDSGIQLISPSDSGLSLDQPVALGSSARRLLDIPTEDLGAVEELAVEGAPEALKPDDDFLLTAMDDTGGEESDSGSQVIALDTDDELGSGMFAGTGSGAALLEEEPSLGGAPMLIPTSTFGAAPSLMGGGVMGGAAMGGAAMGGPTAAAPIRGEYTTANITVLAICAVFLLFCGMLTFDLMRNMWSWNGPYQINSSIMDSIGKLGLFDK